jgi:uncharacterized repeat protein (TIGR01451 family)
MNTAAYEGVTISGQDILASLQLTITNASLHDYDNGATVLSPDAVLPEDGAAFPVLTYDNGNGIAGLAVNPCDATYRAVYLAAGYENVGPRAAARAPDAAEALHRSIAWAAGGKPVHGVSVVAIPSRQLDEPGQTVDYDLLVINTGSTPAAYELSAAGHNWPTRILSGTVEVTRTAQIPPCATQGLTLEVDIPTAALAGDTDSVTVTVAVHPTGTPSANATLTTVAFPQWKVEPNAPYAASRVSLAGWENSVYLIGGDDQGGPGTEHYEFDACTSQWIARAPIPVGTRNHAAAAVDGKIYVTGGAVAGAMDNLQIYDIAGDTWSAGAPLPEARWAHTAAAINGEVYVVGGLDDVEAQATTFVYSPTLNSWRTVAPMSNPRYWVASAAANGKLYVVGGDGEVSTVEEYDPVADAWTTKAPMLQGRAAAGATSLGDYVFVAGGGYTQYLSSAERYDPATDTWTFISSLNTGRRTLGVGSAAGKIFAANGWNGSYRNNLESLRLFGAFCFSDKSAWQSTVQPGGHITYTVEIHSDPVEMTGASLVDAIPSGTAFAGFGVNTVGATYDSLDNQVEWSGAISANADPLTFTFGVDVAIGGWTAGDSITNTVSFDSGTGLVFTRTASSVLAFPDPSPSHKTVDKETALAGDVLTYTICIENGSDANSTFTLRDPIPTQSNYVPGSLTYTLGTGGYDQPGSVITWTGTVEPSQEPSCTAMLSFAVTITSSVPVNTWITNTATITAPYSTVERSAGTLVNPVDVSESWKQADRTQATLGETVVYALFLKNTGVLTTSAVLTDTVPPETAYVPGSLSCGDGSCGYSSGTITWTGDIAQGDPVTLTFGAILTASLPDQAPVTNTARLDDGHSNLYTLEATFLARVSDLSGSFKQASPAWVDPGDTMTYTVYVYNSGAAPTAGQMRDELPPGMTYEPGSLFCGSGSCDHVSGVITWTGAVPPKSMVPVRFRTAAPGGVTPGDVITNTAIITGSYGSVEVGATTLVNPAALGDSWKQAGRAEVIAGETVTYDFLLQNTGTLTATGATLTDPIPPSTTYVPGSVDCSDGSCGYASGVITWTGDITPSGSITVTFAVTLTAFPLDQTPVTNTARLDNGYGNLYDLEAAFLARSFDLGGSWKQASKSFVAQGETVTYDFLLQNTGLLTATSATLTDTVPLSTTYVPGSAHCGDGSCDYGSGVITWTGDIGPSSSVTLTFAVTLTALLPDGTPVTNTAYLDDGHGTAHDLVAGFLACAPDLSGSQKHANRPQAAMGEVVTYNALLQNTGGLTATGAVLTDTLPTETTYVPASVNCDEGSCGHASGVITWTGDIAPSGSITLTFAITVTALLPDATPVVNTAHLADQYGNVHDLEAAFLARSPDLTGSWKQAVPAQVAPGGTVTYTVYVYNSGGAATVAQMRDELGPELTFEAGSLLCGSGSCGYSSGVIMWTGTLSKSTIVPVRFRATASTSASDGDLVTNTAAITDTVWHADYPIAAAVTIAWHDSFLPLVLRDAP